MSTSPASWGVELDLLDLPRGPHVPQDGRFGLHVRPRFLSPRREYRQRSAVTGTCE